MAVTDILEMTLLEEGQQDPHIRINQALERLDDQWFPRARMTPGDDSQFSWTNQGSSTITVTNGIIFLKDVAHSGQSLKIRRMAAPATPYVVTARMILANQRATATLRHGLCFRQSSDGKLHALQCDQGAIRSTKHTSETVASADYANSATSVVQYPQWMRIADDGTNRIVSLSEDGLHWLDWHSIGRTDFMTADQIGFFVDADNATFLRDHGISLLSWQIT